MFKQAPWKAAPAIMAAWKGGMRHPIKLADTAIKAVERRTAVFGRSKARLTMKYWGTDYTVVQGIECDVWKWSTLVAKRQSNLTVAAAEKAIDRALAAKRVSSEDSRWRFTPCRSRRGRTNILDQGIRRQPPRSAS
jgi:hypothetical protein